MCRENLARSVDQLGRRLPEISRPPSLIIAKLIDHDIRVLIFGVGREVAILRRIRTLFKTTTNLHDLERTVLLAPLLDQVEGVQHRLMTPASAPTLEKPPSVYNRGYSATCEQAMADFKARWVADLRN